MVRPSEHFPIAVLILHLLERLEQFVDLCVPSQPPLRPVATINALGTDEVGLKRGCTPSLPNFPRQQRTGIAHTKPLSQNPYGVVASSGHWNLRQTSGTRY